MFRSTDLILLLIATSSCLVAQNDAFTVTTTAPERRCASSSATTALWMGKGLNKMNKQAELRKKMEEAKKQNQSNEDDATVPEIKEKAKNKLTDKEIKERNDRLRFEELLKKGSATVMNDYSSDGYLNKQQEEEEISAALSGVDRIFEGDPAPTECFEELVSIKSENAIGSTGKQRLVPWLHKNSARHNDYLVIVTEPRMESPELKETVKALITELPMDIREKLIIVNADSPAENRRWLKKSGYPEGKVHVYSDEKREFMREYTALGKDRLSMTMFVIQDGRVQKLARDIDQYGASRTVRNAVKALKETKSI